MTRQKDIDPSLEVRYELTPVLMRNRFQMSPKYVVEISLLDDGHVFPITLDWYPKDPKECELDALHFRLQEVIAPFLEAALQCSGLKEGDIW